MKKELNKNQKAMLGSIREHMESLYDEMKRALQLEGEFPDMGHSLENAVVAQQSFDLVIGELIEKHKGDGNVCPIVIGAAITKLLVNSLRPTFRNDGTIVCRANLDEITKSFSTLATLPLAMNAWDAFVRKDLDNIG